jgi:hypothetical protein
MAAAGCGGAWPGALTERTRSRGRPPRTGGHPVARIGTIAGAGRRGSQAGDDHAAQRQTDRDARSRGGHLCPPPGTTGWVVGGTAGLRFGWLRGHHLAAHGARAGTSSKRAVRQPPGPGPARIVRRGGVKLPAGAAIPPVRRATAQADSRWPEEAAAISAGQFRPLSLRRMAFGRTRHRFAPHLRWSPSRGVGRMPRAIVLKGIPRFRLRGVGRLAHNVPVAVAERRRPAPRRARGLRAERPAFCTGTPLPSANDSAMMTKGSVNQRFTVRPRSRWRSEVWTATRSTA